MSLINFKDALMPFIHGMLPGCPGALIQQHANEAVRHFCNDTHCWKYTCQGIGIRADRAEYEVLCIPEEAEIVVIEQVKINERILKPISEYTVTNRNVIILMRTPKESIPGGLVVSVVLRPRQNTFQIDDCETFETLWNDWNDAIRYRTLSTLQVMPGTTWTNMDQSAYNDKMYYGKRAECRRDLNKSQTTGSLRLQSPHRWTGSR